MRTHFSFFSLESVEDGKGVVRSQAGETYFDGSIEQDIPVAGLAEMVRNFDRVLSDSIDQHRLTLFSSQFNCQFFIACQCNPHVVPFFFNRFVRLSAFENLLKRA